MSFGAAVPSKTEAGDEIVARYLESTARQQEALKGMSMDVQIDAWLPRLKKFGHLSALRKISKVGQVTYKVLGFSGDDTVKKDVIARYLTAETQARKDNLSIGISPQNYRFKYKGVQDRDGLNVHVFEVKPIKNRVGLFKGELWIDPQTYMPIREKGEFVKNPSVFLRKVEFVRSYEVQGGIAVPKRIQSTVDTRLVGKAQLAIDFSNYRKVNAEEPVSVGTDAASTTGDASGNQ